MDTYRRYLHILITENRVLVRIRVVREAEEEVEADDVDWDPALEAL